MTPLTIFGLFAVTAMLVCYALEERSRWSFWPSPELAPSAHSTVFCREPGHSDWSRPSGLWLRYGGGRRRHAQSDLAAAFYVHLSTAKFFQHLGIDVAAADDGHV